METKQAKDNSIPKTLRALVVSSMFPFIGDNHNDLGSKIHIPASRRQGGWWGNAPINLMDGVWAKTRYTKYAVNPKRQ